jgi:hypothetical protein
VPHGSYLSALQHSKFRAKAAAAGAFPGFVFYFGLYFQKKKIKKFFKNFQKKKRAKRPGVHQRLSPGNPAQAISGPYPQWLARNRAPSSKEQ